MGAHGLDIVYRVLMALLCGGAIGIERELTDHPAGVRTHILVSMGACLFTTMSLWGFPGFLEGDRVAAGVVTGIGFIGAGAIITSREGMVKGLTTAASLWSAAAVGMVLGAGFFKVGLVCTAIILVVLELLHVLAESVFTRVKRESYSLNIKGEYRDDMLEAITSALKEMRCAPRLMRLHRADGGQNMEALFVAKVDSRADLDGLTSRLYEVPGVTDVIWS